MDESILGHTTAFWNAIGAMVNAVVVIALAIINTLYLAAARRQAKAAESQAKAATLSAAALQSAQVLTDARENKTMRAGVEQMLRFFSGLRDSFQKYQRMGSFPPPSEWTLAVDLLKLRHPACVSNIEAVTTCLKEIHRLYPAYDAIALQGGQYTMQPAGPKEPLIQQVDTALAALEKVSALLQA